MAQRLSKYEINKEIDELDTTSIEDINEIWSNDESQDQKPETKRWLLTIWIMRIINMSNLAIDMNTTIDIREANLEIVSNNEPPYTRFLYIRNIKKTPLGVIVSRFQPNSLKTLEYQFSIHNAGNLSQKARVNKAIEILRPYAFFPNDPYSYYEAMATVIDADKLVNLKRGDDYNKKMGKQIALARLDSKPYVISIYSPKRIDINISIFSHMLDSKYDLKLPRHIVKALEAGIVRYQDIRLEYLNSLSDSRENSKSIN